MKPEHTFKTGDMVPRKFIRAGRRHDQRQLTFVRDVELYHLPHPEVALAPALVPAGFKRGPMISTGNAQQVVIRTHVTLYADRQRFVEDFGASAP